MIKRVLKSLFFQNCIFFILGFLTMLGFQLNWLNNHEPEYIKIRLFMAPVLTGLLFVVINICIWNYSRWVLFLERSNKVEKIFITTGEIIRHEYLYAICLLFILLFLAFPNIFIVGKTFCTSSMCPGTMPLGPYKYEEPNVDRPVMDTGASAWVHEPWAKKIQNEFKHRKWPLWNPNSGVGVPFLANMQSAPFSPLRILVHISDSPIIWDIYFLGRLFVAGFFSYWFLRVLNQSVIASLGGSIIFMLSGYNILYINMGHLDVDVLVPAILISSEWLYRDWRPRNAAFGSLIVCFAVLGGMPESTFFVLLFGFAYYSFRIISNGISGKVKKAYYVNNFYRFFLVVLLGLLMSGPQLFPFLEYLKFSWVSHSISTGAMSNPLLGGISMIIPYFFGKIHQNWNEMNSFSLGAYVGILAIFLSFIAMFGKKIAEEGKVIFFLAGFNLFFISKYFGFSFINWIGYLPIFNRLIFAKYCIPEFSFCVAALAGYGIDTLIANKISAKMISLSFGLVFGIIFIYLGIRPLDLFPQLKELNVLGYAAVQTAIALLFLSAGYIISLMAKKASKKRLSMIFLTLLVLVEMIFYIPKGRAVRYDVARMPPFMKFLKKDTEKFRVLGMNSILYPNSSSFYNIDCITDLDAMYPLRYMSFIREFVSPKIHDRFVGTELSSDLEKILRYLDLMNVKYVLSTSELNELIPEILEKSKIIPENRRGINATEFTINGKTKSVLFQHPPSSITYPVYIPAKAVLSFSIALSPECWSPIKGDGVRFRIKIKEGEYQREIFSKTIDPKNKASDRRWFDYSIRLSEYKNKRINLIFETDPLTNSDYDWAGWGGIKLLSKENSEKIIMVYDREIKIFQNTNVFPRAFMVPKAILAKDEKDALAILKHPRLDLKTFVVLEEGEEGVEFAFTNRKKPAWEGQAEIIGYDSNEVVIKTTGSKEGFLILTDLYYPGWKAYVDGNQQKILKGDYLFRALYLKSGDHFVRFIYDPWVFKMGWISFFLAVLSLGLVFIIKRK